MILFAFAVLVMMSNPSQAENELEPVQFPKLKQSRIHPGDVMCSNGTVYGNMCCTTPPCKPRRSCRYHVAPCTMLAILRTAVHYTADAAGRDIKSIARTAIRLTNRVYVNSLIPIKLQLSRLKQSIIPDTSDARGMLMAFGAQSSHADMHILLVNRPRACGISMFDCTKHGRCFAVVKVSCAINQFSFAHEIGHMHGANHNMEAMDYGPDTLDNHGYVLKRGYAHEGGMRTIMSYAYVDETRIPYYSNPMVKVDNMSTGAPLANNARVIAASRYDF